MEPQVIETVKLVCGNCHATNEFAMEQVADHGRLRCPGCGREMVVRRIAYLLQTHNATVAAYRRLVEQLASEGAIDGNVFTGEVEIYGIATQSSEPHPMQGLPRV